MAQRRRRRRGKRRQVDPKQLEQRAQKRDVRALFRRCGFDRIKVENLEFSFRGRTGELDDLYVSENLIVLAEYTTVGDASGHLFKKKVLFDLIDSKPGDWLEEFRPLCPELDQHIRDHAYSASQYLLKIVYCTKSAPSDEAKRACPYLAILGSREVRYFLGLTKTIERSARFELFKFLEFAPNRIGDRARRAAAPVKQYSGFLLPESYSSFPKGYRVVSFYADPETLLETSFVLRKDSWQDPESLYQRMLMPKKIRNMRRYLSGNRRVFVNNIIVSLPSETALNHAEDSGLNLADSQLEEIQPVTIQLPHRYNSIGIIDGQHRIFCYHEGKDAYEKSISPLRKTQHLLITGLVYPRHLPEEKRRKFEAELFLEINDEQTKARSDLKQSIALLLRPTSNVAICKAIVYRLAERGPLKDLLEVHFFDDRNKLKTASIVSYGLRPLVKFDGEDTLFKLWKHEKKEELKASTRESYPIDGLRSYIDFCTDRINDLLIAAKLRIGPERWKTQADGGLLSPTVVNGFIVCLRELVVNNKAKGRGFYETCLAGVDSFSFKDYKSSHWKRLGLKIAERYFSIKRSTP